MSWSLLVYGVFICLSVHYPKKPKLVDSAGNRPRDKTGGKSRVWSSEGVYKWKTGKVLCWPLPALTWGAKQALKNCWLHRFRLHIWQIFFLYSTASLLSSNPDGQCGVNVEGIKNQTCEPKSRFSGDIRLQEVFMTSAYLSLGKNLLVKTGFTWFVSLSLLQLHSDLAVTLKPKS